MEVQDAIPAGLPLMAEVGCTISFNSDSDEMARRLNVEAGKAVKYGRQTEEEALAFVTINPAKQLGIDTQTGSIEVGKDADLAVWSGPPLSSLSKCERTFVDGRELFSIEQDAAHRKTIAAERSRLIQKLLADGKKAKADGDEKKDDAGAPTDSPGPRRRGPRPPQLAGMTDAEVDALQAYYLDVMERGRPVNEAGACGCGLGHE
jgi:N-acetylglucosamine-6-phosphate deacetylase